MAKFIDEAQISVKAGDGGNGCLSFFRGPNLPKGGPDGGDGGRGGSIYFRADPQLNSLLDFRYQRHYKAERGADGAGKKMNGRKGEDLYIRVPLGTVLRDENGDVLADLTTAGEEFLVAKGGKGGRGNWHFRSSTNQAPRETEPGQEGEEHQLQLTLKSLCDVGLVGYPNVGKSSLMRALTPSKTEVGAYPFTTLQPQLGTHQGAQGFLMADIPGLIEGASENKGLGHRFLKHIQRSEVLLFVLAFDTEISLLQSYEQLKNELNKFDPSLLEKKFCVCVNKSDLLSQDSLYDKAQRELWLKEWKLLQRLEPQSLLISVQKRDGLDPLIEELQSLLFSEAKVCYS